jgi:hypothetical protein
MSCAEHAHRQEQFAVNKAFVEAWNADPTHTHSVELNHLADLSDEEYRTLVLMPKSDVVSARRRDGLAKVNWRNTQHTTQMHMQLSIRFSLLLLLLLSRCRLRKRLRPTKRPLLRCRRPSIGVKRMPSRQ